LIGSNQNPGHAVGVLVFLDINIYRTEVHHGLPEHVAVCGWRTASSAAPMASDTPGYRALERLTPHVHRYPHPNHRPPRPGRRSVVLAHAVGVVSRGVVVTVPHPASSQSGRARSPSWLDVLLLIILIASSITDLFTHHRDPT